MKAFLRSFSAIGLALSFIVMFDGCTQRMIDFTVISSKNVDLRFKEGGKAATRVKGTHSVVVFLIPFGQPNLKAAVDNAIENAGPGYDALIDGVVYYWNKSFIFGKHGFTVEGTPVKTSELMAELKEKGHPVLFHSSLGISNDKSLQHIGVQIPMGVQIPIGE